MDDGYRFLDVDDPAAMKEQLDQTSLQNFVRAAEGALAAFRARARRRLVPVRAAHEAFDARSRCASRSVSIRDRAEVLDDTGHMSGVDTLLALDRAARAGRVRDGDVVLLLARRARATRGRRAWCAGGRSRDRSRCVAEPSAVKAALVTGAAGGIGGAIVERLEADGWSVHGVDVDDADLTTREGNRVVVDAALERFGRLDAVVANAGFQHVAPVEEFPEDAMGQARGATPDEPVPAREVRVARAAASTATGVSSPSRPRTR